jgi:hypothetical protein
MKNNKDIKMEILGKELKEFYDFQITKLNKKLEKNKTDKIEISKKINELKEKKKNLKD